MGLWVRTHANDRSRTRRFLRGALPVSVAFGLLACLALVAAPSSLSAAAAGQIPAGSTFVPIVPSRLVDSRTGVGLGGAAAPLAPGSTTIVQVTGNTVPAEAVGVVMNLTYTNPTGDGYLTVYPAGSANPGTSNLNKVGPGPVANSVTVRLGTAGDIALYNQGGATDVIVDLAGYYIPGSGAQGPPGPQGETGATGAQGVAGPVGPGSVGTVYDLPGSGGVSGGSYLSLLSTNTRAELNITCNYGVVGDTEAFWFANDPSVTAGSIGITNAIDTYLIQSFSDLQYNAGGQDRAFDTTGDQGPRPWHGVFTVNDGGTLSRWDVTFADNASGGCTTIVYANGEGLSGVIVHP